MGIAAVGRGALILLYPAAVYVALEWIEPRIIALVLIALLLVRQRRQTVQLLGGLSLVSRAILGALLLLCAGAAAVNDETLLRLYPGAINLGMLALFALSLRHPPSMIERFARLRHPDLPEAGVHYTRQVTQVWCGFFFVNALVAAWTAVAVSREAWALYNGLIAYVLMGTLFAGEWLVRQRLFPEAR